ncbi:MAG: aminoacyl-tRNA hydrolase [Ruminococcus sp.]|nr:aminoacyl-tRNA hydrolase [Ruminococcus sp.]
MSIFDKFKEIAKASEAVSGKPIEYLIVGLGNPGLQYEKTRHNAGFMVMDALAQKLGFSISKYKFKAKLAEAEISGRRCLVMKPETYMNNSGQAVAEAMNFYKLDIDHVIIVYDDISLEPGLIRIRRKGSDGGHNGIKSIIALTGEDKFPRIKMGVGKKPHPKFDLADWVLSKFKEDDQKKVDDACQKVCESLELIVKGNIDEAMNKFNS